MGAARSGAGTSSRTPSGQVLGAGVQRESARKSRSSSSVRPVLSFPARPNNKDLMNAGARVGDVVKVQNDRKLYEVFVRQLKGKEFLAIKQKVEVGKKKVKNPMAERRVPPRTGNEKVGDMVEWKGTKFVLVKGAKKIHWVKVKKTKSPQAPPPRKKTSPSSRSTPRLSPSPRKKTSSSSRSPPRLSPSPRKKEAARKILKAMRARRQRRPASSLDLPDAPKTAPKVRSRRARSTPAEVVALEKRLMALKSPKGKGKGRVTKGRVTPLSASCFQFVIKPECKKQLLGRGKSRSRSSGSGGSSSSRSSSSRGGGGGGGARGVRVSR